MCIHSADMQNQKAPKIEPLDVAPSSQVVHIPNGDNPRGFRLPLAGTGFQFALDRAGVLVNDGQEDHGRLFLFSDRDLSAWPRLPSSSRPPDADSACRYGDCGGHNVQGKLWGCIFKLMRSKFPTGNAPFIRTGLGYVSYLQNKIWLCYEIMQVAYAGPCRMSRILMTVAGLFGLCF